MLIKACLCSGFSGVCFVSPVDSDVVSCSGVWNLLRPQLFHLGGALLWGGECQTSTTWRPENLPVMKCLNKYWHHFFRFPSQQCWPCCACGSVFPCPWSTWATTLVSASSPMTTPYAPTRSLGRSQSSAGTWTSLSGECPTNPTVSVYCSTSGWFLQYNTVFLPESWWLGSCLLVPCSLSSSSSSVWVLKTQRFISWKRVQACQHLCVCVTTTGHLGEPVLLPLWLPVSGLHHLGGLLLSDQHRHGLLPALCRGECF